MATRKAQSPLRTAEVFAGIGGVTAGFMDAGFAPVFMHDIDPEARAAFAGNFPKFAKRYVVGDVRKLTGPQMLRRAGGRIDGLLGCPPCQGMSPIGPRKSKDLRNQLVSEFARLVKSTKPRFFVMENVPRLLKSAIFVEFTASLETRYRLHAAVVNVAEFGVPQLRRRAVVIGIRRDLGVEPSMPKPTHGGSGQVFDYATGRLLSPTSTRGRRALQLGKTLPAGMTPLVTLGDAIGDLSLAAGAPNAKQRVKSPKTAFQRAMRSSRIKAPSNHIAWKHRDETTKFLKAVDPGSAPNELGTRYRNTRYFSQAYARLHRRGLARTVTTNFHNPGSGRFTHYGTPRALTVREALRIQSFPDNFEFDLNDLTMTSAERLVGNAFPRRLAAVVARHLRKLLVTPSGRRRRSHPRGLANARRIP